MDNAKLKICVIDDEDLLRITVADELKESGYSVIDFANPLEALEYIKHDNPNIVISDVKMPKLDGISLLKKIKSVHPNTHVIIMTAFASVPDAVEAIKIGAFQYLIKPFKISELELTLSKIKELSSLKASNLEYQNIFKNKYSIDNFWGISDEIIKVKESITLIADSDTNILITGETGTGKEVVANTLHYLSPRAKKPLIKVSCAILSPEIIESELFGHERGAFTGADKTRIGRFEEADGGTIYLDDIDDVPLNIQVKLLRVLQENEIEKVGSSRPIKINVRIIASTKVNLLKLVQEGKFREDLYYRLNIFPITLPPLRERKEDIKYLINKFIELFGKKGIVKVEDDAAKLLINYNWPGNVRELKNFVERSLILARDNIINLDIIPKEYFENIPRCGQFENSDKSLPEMVSTYEKEIIIQALNCTENNITKAASILKIPHTTLRSKMEKYKM